MKKNKNFYKFVFSLGLTILVSVFLVNFYFNHNVKAAQQASGNALMGWMWSSNIGWISVNCANTISNCSDWQVQLSQSGNKEYLQGYGWSSNIGWINFNPDTTNAPSYAQNPASPAYINLATGNLSGWIRACNVFQNGCNGALKNNMERGGWDGWISLAGNWVDNSNTPLYEGPVRLNGNIFEGFAWGGDVVGWLAFSGPNFSVTKQISSVPLQNNNSSSSNPNQGIWQEVPGGR